MLSQPKNPPDLLLTPEAASQPIDSQMLPRLSRRVRLAANQPIGFLMHKALAHPELISLAAGFVDSQTLPFAATRRAFEAVLSDPVRASAALQYGTTSGYPPLREALLDAHLAADGQDRATAGLETEQVIVTAGSNELLHLLCEMLCDPGDVILCGAPTYLVFLGITANLDIRAAGVTVDERGLVPEALDLELSRRAAAGELERVKAVYLVSYFDNPAGVTLAEGRRAEIVEIVRRWSQHGRIYIIEDKAYRPLRFEGPDVPSLRSFDPDGETVITTHTFSKSFSPGIRVGYGILPKPLVNPICEMKGNIDFGSPNLAQHLMAEVLHLGLYDSHVDLLRRHYRRKRDVMLRALDDQFSSMPGVTWRHPAGGLYVWFTLPPEIDAGPSGRLFDVALDEGVLYVPGQYSFPPGGGGLPKNHIRLSFGVQDEAGISAGIEALARAVGRVTA